MTMKISMMGLVWFMFFFYVGGSDRSTSAPFSGNIILFE